MALVESRRCGELWTSPNPSAALAAPLEAQEKQMRQARGGPLRLLKSLRGHGSLLWGRRTARPVSYCIDLYGQGQLLSGNGDLTGEFSDLIDRMPAEPRLRLESGQEVRVLLSDIRTDAVSIELQSPVPIALA